MARVAPLEDVLQIPSGYVNWPCRGELAEMVAEKDVSALVALSANFVGNPALAVASPGSAAQVEGLARRLGADTFNGLPHPVPDLPERQQAFGSNFVAEKKLKSYLAYSWDALHDHILILLLVMATLTLAVELSQSDHAWEEAILEPAAIYLTVILVVNVTASLDWKRERMFAQLSEKLEASNKKFVVRGGETLELEDSEIVVGDVLLINAHMAASIPADGVLLSYEGVKMDESSLTGETKPIVKSEKDPFLFSGTIVNAGTGRMLILAVGENSMSGRIKNAVYGIAGEEDEAEVSPLFAKLDLIAMRLGKAGMLVAVICFGGMCLRAFFINEPKAQWTKLFSFLISALTIMAVAIPEGLPLAVTVSLAFSSRKMSDVNNLVKTLDSCETMGSATTICTDKTGTLTANRMAVRAAYFGGLTFDSTNSVEITTDTRPLGCRIRTSPKISNAVVDLIARCISVCTMDESSFSVDEFGNLVLKGNPTECAMLMLTTDLEHDYRELREMTRGRSQVTISEGKLFNFTSARKMMSWTVPRPEGGYTVFAKGASEIILGRVTHAIGCDGEPIQLMESEKQRIDKDVVQKLAARSMRTIGLACRDLDELPDAGTELDAVMKNSDGSSAYVAETQLTLIGIVGIEDPLRPEVPRAIERCYKAGIDVRMVTGDNLDTAVAVAEAAGILKLEHFNRDVVDDLGRMQLKPTRAIEGREFRMRCHKYTTNGEALFNQQGFDEMWPYLRVLARSSPEDKLTLAKGLNQSLLFQDKLKCETLLNEGIAIFPDRQVIAMTGDGTNDAPALKVADIGFAMGISGTQIAKDAANIILLDDNFASIVVAANWGRNVYDSIQKFIQFQLTVNIAVVVVSVIGVFVHSDVPVQAVQMLWINLIMDSFASLALASEAPNDQQLKRPPVNRTSSIVSERMWYNMLGQDVYQIAALLFLLQFPEHIPNNVEDACCSLVAESPCNATCFWEKGSIHYTMIFNALVFMTLFNQVNSRKLEGEWHVWGGLLGNSIFIGIWMFELVLQIIMISVGGRPLAVAKDGLDKEQWVVCIAFGLGTIPWQFAINTIAYVTRVGRRGPGETSPTSLRNSKRRKLGKSRTL